MGVVAAVGEVRPWQRFYGDVPRTLHYPPFTLYEAVKASAARTPEAIAFDFMDHRASYAELIASIDRCADGLAALGMRAGDRLTVAMPTVPQGVIAVYAANRLGAVPAMIHPLSTPAEIESYVRTSGSRCALTLDALHERFAGALARTPLEKLILARIPDYLHGWKRLGYWVTRGRRLPAVPRDPRLVWWSDMIGGPHSPAAIAGRGPDDAAVIMYSGGTTGVPKGIVLTNRNLVSEGLQVAAWARMQPGDSILAVLPLFHGFGLGVCINAAFMAGGCSILVPAFDPETIARLIVRKRPNLLVGVPTLYAALARHPALARADLSCLRATFCGADTLPRPVKERFETLVTARGGCVKLLEGYGLTEAVSAIMAMPLGEYREGSMGVPFPDMLAKIVHVGTTDEAATGEEGEICISGPAVMRGYLDAPEANAETLRKHDDGRVWLHTGDVGRRDEDGFFYFVCRLKRMIKSSGFNVYPTQVEALLYRHPAVAEACVVGVPDEAQVERVKAFIVLKEPSQAGEAMSAELIEYCRAQLIKWSCPREIEFRDALPKTHVGKVDFKALSDLRTPAPEQRADRAA